MTATVDDTSTLAKRRSGVSGGLLAVAAALWLASLLRINVDAVGSYGLLSAFPVTMYLALAVLTVSMARAIHRDEPNRVLAAHVVLFLLIVHGTPAVLYETLRYSWAWRHLGLVDYLARHHTVDTHVRNLNAYQSWPGFFSVATTWLGGSGARSWIGPAQWAPLFFELLDALALYAILDALDPDRRVVWTGVWLFALGNWIGQDYFSPQAFAFFLYLVVILLVVRFLARRPAMPRMLTRLVRVAAPEAENAQTAARPHVGAAVGLVGLCTAAIASSHPLTPFVLVFGLALVALVGGLTVRWLPAAAAGIVALWLVTGAQGYMRVTLPSLVTGLNTLGGTVDQSLSKSAHAQASQHLVSLVGRAEVLLIVVVALVGVVRRVRNRRWDATAIVLAGAPAAILTGGSYGGEAVFRVYLFALPFLAYFAATCCYPTRDHRRWRSGAGVLAVSLVTLTGFMFGYFGKEEWAHFSLRELDAAATVFVDAPPNSLVVDGTADYPIGFANFEHITYVHLSAESAGSVAALLAAPEPFLYGWLADTRYARGYIIITRSQKAEADALGLLPRGALDRIERVLLASARFTALYHDDDASVFTVTRPSVAGTP